LVGACTDRQTQHLMAETDPEHRYLTENPPQHLGRSDQRFGVAGTVGDEHAPGLAGHELEGRGPRGDHIDSVSTSGQMGEDVGLDAKVYGHHQTLLFGGGSNMERLPGADPRRQVLTFHARSAARDRSKFGLVDVASHGDGHGTAVTEMTGESSG